MRRWVMTILIVLLMGQQAFAQSTEDKRRVEEQKRLDLKASELYITPKREVALPKEDVGYNSYFQSLLSREAATNADAFKVVMILLGRDADFPETAAQFRFLKEAGFLSRQIRSEASTDALLRKGAAAYMFGRAAGIKGGLTLRLFGYSQRYAFKELVYQGLMLPGDDEDVISGWELIWTLTQMADYMSGPKKSILGIGR